MWRCEAAHGPPCAPCIRDASGVRPKAAPAVRNGLSSSISVREIVAGDGGSSEPPRRLSGGKCSGSCTVSCAARRRSRRRRCPHLCGRDCTARCGAKCADAPQERAHERRHRCAGWCIAQCASRWTAKPTPATHGVRPRRAEAMPAAGVAGQGERGEHGDERGAQRRRAECTAVTAAMPANRGTSVSFRQRRGAQRAAGQTKCAATEGSGGARDTRPKGRDRAAGSAG